MLRPFSATTAASVPNTPTGAKFMINPTIFKIICAATSNVFTTGFAYSPKFAAATPKKIENTTICKISLLAIASNALEGIICSTNFCIENSDDLFCNQLLNAFSHGRLKNTNFKIDKGILLNFKVDFQNGFKVETKLIKKQKINTLLSISKEEIKYN